MPDWVFGVLNVRPPNISQKKTIFDLLICLNLSLMKVGFLRTIAMEMTLLMRIRFMVNVLFGIWYST